MWKFTWRQEDKSDINIWFAWMNEYQNGNDSIVWKLMFVIDCRFKMWLLIVDCGFDYFCFCNSFATSVEQFTNETNLKALDSAFFLLLLSKMLA